MDSVISLLLKMMTDFRGQSGSEEQETDKTGYMQEQQALVMSQNALLNANKGQVASLTEGISKLRGDIAGTIRSVDELTMLRRQEHSQHEAELADLTKTIDAVNKAIEILEGQYAANGATLAEIKNRVQLALSLANADDNKVNVITAGFMQMGEPDWLGVDGSKYEKY